MKQLLRISEGRLLIFLLVSSLSCTAGILVYSVTRPPEVEQLLDSLEDEDPHVVVASASSLRNLATHEDKAIQALKRILDESDPMAQRSALSALGMFGESAKGLLPTATKLLESPDPYVRLDGAAAIWNISGSSTQIMPVLVDALESENIMAKGSAMDILSGIGPAGKQAVPTLIGLLGQKEEMPVTRQNAATTLGYIRSEPDLVLPVLIDALSENSSVMKRAAAHALGEFGSQAKPALPPLIMLAENSSDTFTRQVCADAVWKIDVNAASSANLVRSRSTGRIFRSKSIPGRQK